MFRKRVKGTVGDRTCLFYNENYAYSSFINIYVMYVYNTVTPTVPLSIFTSMYFYNEVTPTVPLTIFTSMYFYDENYAYSSFNNIYVNVFLQWKLRLQFFLTIFTSMYFYNAKNEEPFDLCSRQTSCQFFVVFWESFRRLQNVWAVWARIYQWIVRLILTN